MIGRQRDSHSYEGFILIGVFIAECLSLITYLNPADADSLAPVVFIFRTYAIWNSSKKLLLGLTAVAIFIGSPAVYTTYKGINGVGCEFFAENLVSNLLTLDISRPCARLPRLRLRS